MTRLSEIIRFYVVVGILASVSFALAGRLVVLHGDLLSKKLDQPNYGFKRDMQGLRGAIYPSNRGSAPFARSVPVWVYHVDPASVTLKQHTRREVAETVAEALQMPFDDVMKAYSRVDSRYVYLTMSSDTEANKVLSNPKKVSGLRAEEIQIRRYPQGRRLSHVLGFVSKDPTNSVGSAGIEMRYERYLRGIPGKIEGEVDARRVELYDRRLVSTDPRPGCDVYLTIDQNLQYEVETALAKGVAKSRAQAGWAIVLQVKTGAVLAMASLPDYEPETYNRSSSSAKKNLAVCEIYEPGSVMKTITACAALDCGIASPSTTYSSSRNDTRYYRLPTDSHGMDPVMTVGEALVHSCNVVYGKIGVDVGPKRLWSYMDAFGLGRKTGIDLPGEEYGILPRWEKWDKVKWSRAPIGQGVAVTGIQIAAAYAAIANDGELLRPYVVEKVVSKDEGVLYQHVRDVRGHPIKASTARNVREMMLGVAKKGGTARRAAVQGYSVAGKTGTAQMKEGRGYSSVNFNASFVGIVPASRPELVILVTLQKPFNCRSWKLSQETGIPLYNHQGGVCAAPVFRRIAWTALKYLEVQPDQPDDLPEDMDMAEYERKVMELE
ncbi:MAG: penicillin-binding protein 2 [Kiritimatiellae bacterium]|nr:penicillin-binding protein 2 [Kiritimatiellia bacterium]